MNKIKILTFLVIALVGVFLIAGCAPRTEAPAAAAPQAAPQSDGSEDLKVDFRLNLAEEDVGNYFTFSGNIRYMAVDKDQVDATTGASKLGSTHLFQSYLYDVEGKTTLPSALRGLLLFGVNPYDQIATDSLNAAKGADGTITIQYTHRGTAYRITTDAAGKLSFPDGRFEQRAIGYIPRGNPQVISKDFSADGTAATVNWAKVWDSGIAGGTKVDADSDRTTGNIAKNGAAADSMYYFDGTLDVKLENDILTIAGFLTAVGR